jgi:hypothetical protein
MNLGLESSYQLSGDSYSVCICNLERLSVTFSISLAIRSSSARNPEQPPSTLAKATPLIKHGTEFDRILEIRYDRLYDKHDELKLVT